MFTSVRNAILLGSSAAAMLAAIGAASAEDAGAQMLVPPATMAQADRTAVLGAGAHRAISNLSSDQGEERTPMTRETAPHLIKEGLLSTIPQGSPMGSEPTGAAVAAKEIQRTLTLLAVVEADPSRTAHVLPLIAGRVVDLKVQLGDRVARHQELAVVYTGLAQAYSDDRRSRSVPAFPNEVTSYDRQTDPKRNRDAAAECQRPEAEPARMARLCALVTPAAGMQSTQLLSLKAPVAGSIVDLKISPGAILNDPSASIMTIADLDTILVTTSLPKRNAPLLPTGQSVEIVFIAYPDEVFTGEARFFSNMLDPDPSSFKVRIELPNPSRRLKPNMFAFATFFWRKESVPIIPTRASIEKNETDRVLMEVEQ
jgi:membrane fusion protein, heavy metal efflux system